MGRIMVENRESLPHMCVDKGIQKKKVTLIMIDPMEPFFYTYSMPNTLSPPERLTWNETQSDQR